MSYKQNTAVADFPIGRLTDKSDGAEITAGTVTGTYLLDGAAGTLSGSISYDATAKCWKIDSLAAAELDGAIGGYAFSHDDAVGGGIFYNIKTVQKLVGELNDSTTVQIADAVWDELQASHTVAGSFGFYLDAAISQLGVSTFVGAGGSGNYLQDLLTTRNNVAAQLADITANPKPSYDIDGQKVDWDTHFRELSTRLQTIELALQGAEPFEVHSTGYTG